MSKKYQLNEKKRNIWKSITVQSKCGSDMRFQNSLPMSLSLNMYQCIVGTTDMRDQLCKDISV
ncbi:hypothetical protein E2986_12730 [Frieseomelitta varia]|uniref:Uncharacterized protein n=1 Tax=Frieseomelitta varia TaxID=561572 RepID=A0A833R977_9HYME|nr:hypothetical protein E2986_12730 [Frieseomelitta varia]